jgi:sugar diacid utilization regulator
MARRRLSVLSAARELVERLTAALGVPFTLTDDGGVVVASTGGHPGGHIEQGAIAVLRDGEPMEVSPDDARGPADLEAPAFGGLLAGRAGVYLPVRMDGRIEGVLIAHGPPDVVWAAGQSAVAAVGLALDFTHAASLSVRQSPGPDIALHQLLRGSFRDARRAALVAKVIGWDLGVPRVAVVVLFSELADAGEHYSMIADFIQTVAPGTPMGQLEPTEWAFLPELSARAGPPSPAQFADDVRAGLANAGVTPTIGIGEPHADRTLPALRQSYREAAFTARIAQRMHAAGGTYSLTDLGPAAFLAPDTSTRRHLSERLIRPVRAQPEVVGTLEAFLRSNLSLSQTAESTGLHRHTIRNHLDRIQHLTGLNPRVLDDALQLRMGLILNR